jgi:predicted ribosome quality control (RQC) complex YloA/Tae2 family protein
MIRHHYTLQKLTEELRTLCGSVLVECFTQEKDSLMLGFYDGEKINYMQFRGEARYGALYLRQSFSRAGSNSTDLLPRLIGSKLTEVTLKPDDRVIKLQLGRATLIVLLYGGSRNNIILAEGINIVDSFKAGTDLKGKTTKNLFVDKEYSEPEDRSILKHLSAVYPYLGKYYAKQFLKNRNFNTETKVSELDQDELSELIESAVKFKTEILTSNEFYLLRNKFGELLLSMTTIDDYPEIVGTYNSISKAIEHRIRKDLIESEVTQLKKNIIPRLTRIRDKLQSRIEQTTHVELNDERQKKYRLFAELLLSQPDIKTKFGDKIVLNDWTGESREIKLKTELNLAENAKRYFDKSKDLVQAYEARQRLLPQLKDKLSRSSTALQKLTDAQTKKEFEKIMGEYKDILKQENVEQEQESRFRMFDLGDGYILYVGKNAANNDELTLRFAKPNDLWFHARGSSGSHAVLRLNKEEKVPKHIMQKAASITAYYSGSKKAKYTPVCYTYKKYVHKPKGANPGSVTLSREEVMMAEPKLPE